MEWNGTPGTSNEKDYKIVKSELKLKSFSLRFPATNSTNRLKVDLYVEFVAGQPAN